LKSWSHGTHRRSVRSGRFQVNTYTVRQTSNYGSKAVALDAQGDFVAVWQSVYQDGSQFGIFAQRYNATGVRQGPEFQVNTFTTNNQTNPSVAMDAVGDFVVAWDSDGQHNGVYSIFAQRYNAAGIQQGGEFEVSSFSAAGQNHPSIAMDAAGDFVIAWINGYSNGIYAQRYNAVCVKQGAEFQVNPVTLTWANHVNAAMDTAGDFVITWESPDGSNDGIFAQRYDAAGVAQGSAFQVNTYTTAYQRDPTAAMDAAGDLVIAWDSNNPFSSPSQDGSGYGIFAQRYNAAGMKEGNEFQVKTYTTNNQLVPSVSMDAAGDLIVVWESGSPYSTTQGQDGNGYGIFAQRYDAADVTQGSEFRVNAVTVGNQTFPSVGVLRPRERAT
jgi:hypothetical protein